MSAVATMLHMMPAPEERVPLDLRQHRTIADCYHLTVRYSGSDFTLSATRAQLEEFAVGLQVLLAHLAAVAP